MKIVELELRGVCCVCFDQPAIYAYFNCKHLAMCTGCMENQWRTALEAAVGFYSALSRGGERGCVRLKGRRSVSPYARRLSTSRGLGGRGVTVVLALDPGLNGVTPLQE